MKQIYKLSQLLIAGLVIFSVFIQSCINPTTAAISKEDTPILEVISQLNDQGSLKQLAVSKFIVGKEHGVAFAFQSEELQNENRQEEALLIAKQKVKVEERQERKSERSILKDLTGQKFKLTELSEGSEEPTATCLGKLGAFPIEIIEKILTYIPCDRIKKGKRGEQIVTGIFAIRQTNRIFYELTTGYSQPGLLGVEHRPNRCIHLEACAISKIISFDKLNPATLPSFIFYQFIGKVRNLPKQFWPYLQGTNIHTICVAPHSIVKAVELIKNLEGSKIDTLDFSASYVGDVIGLGLGEVAKSLQGSKVHTVDLSNNYIEREAAVGFAKNLVGTQVHRLDLSLNKIGNEGIVEIAKNLQGTKVYTLNLVRSNIRDEGIAEFGKNLQATQVHTLVLWGNIIGDRGIVALAKNLVGTQVHTLDLSDNQIGNESIAEFGKNLQGTKVYTLNLGGNNIGDEGIAEFGKNLQGTQVHTLYLWNNNIGKAGLIEFTKNLIGTEVEEINISRNKISWNKIKSTQEILEFGQILATTKVRKIDFSLCNTHPTEQKLLIRKYPDIKWIF